MHLLRLASREAVRMEVLDMAVSRNRVDVMGYLGKAPVLTTHLNCTVLTFSVGVTERWTTESGEKREKTEWIRCSLVEKKRDGKTAPRTTFLANALHKGSAVAIEGCLRTREYEKDGETRWSTDVSVDDVQLLDRAPEGAR